MINTVLSINHLDEELLIDLRKPEESGFLISEISGLDPISADIKTTKYSSGDGYIFNHSVSDEREISLKIVLFENNYDHNSIEKLRMKLYKYFPVKKKIRLIFDEEYRVGAIEGYVKSNNVTIFDNNNSAIVDIVCPDIYFKEKDIDYFKHSKSISDITNKQERFNIYYTGEVPTGFILKMTNKSTTTYNGGFVISSGEESMSIDIKKIGGIEPNDTIEINTIPRSMHIYKNGENALSVLINSPKKWPILKCGVNDITIKQYIESQGATVNDINMDISYNILYEGM